MKKSNPDLTATLLIFVFVGVNIIFATADLFAYLYKYKFANVGIILTTGIFLGLVFVLIEKYLRRKYANC